MFGRFLLTSAGLFAGSSLFFAVSASAQSNVKAVGNEPLMTGTAGPELVTQLERAFGAFYAIRQTDNDTLRYHSRTEGVPDVEVQDRDESCQVQVLKLWSLNPERSTMTLGGTDSTGTYRYDVNGEGVEANQDTLFVDQFVLTNTRTDAGKDPDVYVQKRVKVTNVPGSPEKPIFFHKSVLPSLLSRRRQSLLGTSEQKTSQSLKRVLIPLLTPEQETARIQKRRVHVPVRSLSLDLKAKVLNYVRAEAGRVEQVKIDLVRIEDFDIVLLPPPSTALGVYGWDKSGGRVGF